MEKLKKGIDKGEEMWYNTKAAVKKGSERSLKIEQQEISTKQKASANLVLKELYILNKVKEAKIKIARLIIIDREVVMK